MSAFIALFVAPRAPRVEKGFRVPGSGFSRVGAHGSIASMARSGQSRRGLGEREIQGATGRGNRGDSLEGESAGAGALLGAALNAARIGHWHWDLRTGAVAYDSRCADTLGYREGEMAPLYDAWSDHIHPDDLPNCRLSVARHLAGESDRYELEYRVRHRDGRWIWIRSHAAVVQRDSCGTPLRVVGIHQDVTVQKEVEEMLRQRERLDSLGELTGGIAHNFNNSLGIMLATFEQLGRLATGDTMRQLVRIGVEAAEAAGAQVSSLLTVARRQPVESRVEDLRSCLADVARLLRVSLPGRVRLVEDLGSVPLPALVARAPFEGAIVNLVVNARDASQGALRIILRARIVDSRREPVPGLEPSAVAGRFVRIDVEDDGCGMAPEVLRRAFDPFFTTKSATGGTGLGLATVYAFCRAVGGAVRIDSVPAGGTTVTMHLPLAEEAVAADCGSAFGDAEPRAACGRVLVVEDNAALLDLACAVLSDAGYAAAPAVSLAEAEALLGQGRFDIVLSDVSLASGGSGCDLVRWIRANAPGTAAVLMSGLSRPEDADMADVPFVSKPFRGAQLLEAVAGATRARK